MSGRAWAMLLLPSVLWGVSFFFNGVAVRALPSLTIVLARVGIATAVLWIALAGLGLLSTAIAYVLYFRIFAEAGATNLLLVTFVIPVSAVLLGVLVLHEALALRQAAGTALIGAGLACIDGRLPRSVRGAFVPSARQRGSGRTAGRPPRAGASTNGGAASAAARRPARARPRCAEGRGNAAGGRRSCRRAPRPRNCAPAAGAGRHVDRVRAAAGEGGLDPLAERRRGHAAPAHRGAEDDDRGFQSGGASRMRLSALIAA
jgi:hypothetical protein